MDGSCLLRQADYKGRGVFCFFGFSGLLLPGREGCSFFCFFSCEVVGIMDDKNVHWFWDFWRFCFFLLFSFDETARSLLFIHMGGAFGMGSLAWEGSLRKLGFHCEYQGRSTRTIREELEVVFCRYQGNFIDFAGVFSFRLLSLPSCYAHPLSYKRVNATGLRHTSSYIMHPRLPQPKTPTRRLTKLVHAHAYDMSCS